MALYAFMAEHGDVIRLPSLYGNCYAAISLAEIFQRYGVRSAVAAADVTAVV